LPSPAFLHSFSLSFFSSMLRPPPCSPLFPYTTLFRSVVVVLRLRALARGEEHADDLGMPLARRVDHRGLPDPVGRDPIGPLRERSEEHTSELQSLTNLVCRLLLEKKKKRTTSQPAPKH